MAMHNTPVPSTSPSVDDLERVADDRDLTSEAHDQTADARDDRAEARDARAESRDKESGRGDRLAAADRAGAKRDRRAGAGDRKHSEDDREAAAADRIRGAVDRADLVMDGLTGAYQRAPGLVELEREMIKARRTEQPFVLAFIDVDGLKAVNDTQGHAAGDRVLERLVRVVKSEVREYDPVVRVGGDEFVCGLLDLTLHDAADRFARIRQELDDADVSISVGLAALDGDDTLEHLLALADEAMYAQRTGRAPE